MARPWSEVQNSPVYQQLPAEKQAAAKRQYFNNVVAPRVPEDRREKAWAQFDGAAPQAKAEAPGLLSRISSALPERPDLAPHDPQARYWFVDDPEADRKMKETPQQRATPPDPLAAGSRDALLRGDGPRTLRADAAVQAGADAFTVPDDGTLLSLPSTKALVRREGERAKLDATRGANLEALRREAISTRRLEGADADQWAQEEYERRYQAGDSKALKPAEADWSTTFGLGATRAGRGLARGFYGTMEALGDVFGGDELSRYNAEDAARQEAAIAKAVRDAAGAVPAEGFKSIVADALPTVISQSAPIAAAALTAVVTRNPAAVRPFLDAAVLTPMGVQKFGENYRDAKAKGLATEDRVGYALGGALAEVLPERLSLGVLLDVLAKPVAKGGKAAAQKGVARELAERFLMAQGTELATEEVTTVADFILEQHYLNPDLSLKELQDRMMRTALVTPVATTALMGAGATGSVTGSALRNGVSPQARALRELRDTVDGAQFVRGADRAAADLLSPESAQYREIARQEPMSLDAMADRAGVAVSQQAAPQAISSAALATAARTPAAAPSAPAAATAPAAVAGAGAGEALPASLLEDDDAALLQAPSARPSQATAGARGPEGATRGMAAGAQTVSRQDFNVGGKDPHTVSFEHKKDGRLIRTITYPDGEVLSETLAEDRNGNESWVSERAYDQGEFYPRQLSSEEASAAIKDDIGGKAVISAQQPNQAPTALDISPGAITPKPEVLRPQFTHVPGNTGIAATERGIEVPFQYALVEADTLRTSQLDDLSPNPNYPQELQPRDRTRAGSEMQIARMAADIKPRRLGEAPMVSEGAPVIGPDAVVESGNGRTIALRRAYAAGKAKGYYDWLEENADYFGLDPMLVARMRAPVLVRVRTAPVDRLEFVRQANESALLVMSPVEQARADAARIDSMDDLTPTEDGDFAGSRDFIRRFIGRLPATEQAGMIDAAGRLSQAGYARVRNAVLARAYGDSPVMTRLVESMNDNLRNIGKALMSVAPAVAKARTDIVDGALFDADLTPDLIAAVETLSRIKEEGRSIAEELAQLGLLDEGLSMEARELLAFLADNVRRPRKIAEFILRYTEALRAAGNPNQGSLLGEAQAPTKAELLAAARGRTNEAATEQQPAAARQPAAATQSGRTGPAEPAAENRVKPAAEGGGRRGTQGDEGRQVTPQPATAPIETPANAGVSASDLLNPKNGKPFSSITIANQVRKKQADPNAWGVYRRGDAFVLRRWDADTGREADPNWYDQKRASAEAGARYNAWVREQEREAEVRRLQSDRVIRQQNGKPFKTEASAQQFRDRYELQGTHTIEPVDGGFELRLMSPAAQSEARRIAEGRESYSEAQEAVAREMGIGTTPDGEWDVTDAQFDEMERRVNARLRGEPAEPLLQSYTAAEIATQEAEQREREAAEARAEREAAERDRQARERAEVRARSEAAAQTFELGMDPLQNLTGQGGLFGQAEPEAAPQSAPPAASANTIFTEDAAEKARALLRRKLGQLNSGIDPEMLQAGITLAGYHIEKGARTFAAYARAMLGDLGEAVRPYLKSWYMGVKYDPRATGFDGMDSAAAVEAADENADFIGMEQQEQGNGTDKRSSSSVEPDRRNAATQDGLGAEGVRAGPGGDAAGGGRGVRGAQGDGGARRGGELPGRETPPAGKPGDLTVYTGATDVPGSVARSELDRRSARPGIDGAPVEPDAATAIAAAARGGSRLAETKAAQAKADAAPHGARLEDIRAALPALLPDQQEDVFKAEQRFAKPNGYGMLFTNGTGTGKTFTGLGIIKRFALAGKTNILIVAPKDKIIEDWQMSGRVLGLDIGRLQDTQDAGDGIVITTYANFGDNAALASRDWDLVALDEAHYLLQDKDGTPTSYLHALRAITMHPDGVHRRHEMLNGKEIAERNRLAADAKMLRMSDDERQWVQAEKVQDKADMLTRRLDEKLQAIRAEVDGRQGAARPRAVFLSATPFAYEKTIDWANGYLFDYNDGQPSEKGAFRGYNQGSNRDRFFVRHLGYRMRNNKLTQPDAKVDSGLMQRQFNAWLKREGSLSGRMLDVAFDYDRRFILVDSAIGTRIDAALAWFKERTDEYSAANPGTTGLAAALSGKGDPYVRALSAARNQISDKFDYLSRRYLLESIKAREVVPHIREHLALGRKVVVFHDYKKGGGFNPFVLEARSTKEGDADARAFLEQWNKVVREFSTEFADIINSDLFRQSSPIEMFQKEFPDVLLINGNVSDAQRRKNVAKFQDDASGPQVILVQSEAGKEGISLHDTTGKHQRVLFNLGQPTQPTTAIQQEGRIYRTGQQSHAIFRYLNTGTQWEKWAFATTIAQRASTAENLGAGEQARALKDAFIQAFEESDSYRAGMEGEGTGGKARDRLANEALTEYDRARTFYFGQQKKTSSTKAQEGTDYFATPEPVGLKMVEWADIRPGERALEPSAGHGAIARWIPETAERTAIEPSSMLLPRLAMVFDGKIVDGDFESLHVNNKFDAIVMNPPFGTGGKTAIEHLAKAATHLREKGRIVALIPTGPAADKRFEKWFYETEERPVRPIAQIDFGTGPIAIYRGDTVRSRASWAPEAIVTRKADSGALWVKVAGRSGETQITVESLTGHTNTGPRTEAFRPADGLHLIADIQMPGVTFERAGTRVATRIVVIEKQSDPAVAQALASSRQDLSGIEDIGKLFDRLQDMSLPPRAGVIDADADPATRLDPTTPAEPGRVVSDGEAATVERIEGGKLVTDAPEVEHVTQKGKRLKGVIVRSLTKEEAQQADGYTFKKDGGYFVRMAHVTRPPMMSRSASPAAGPAMTRADVAAAVAAQLPSLARSVEAALRRGDEGKAGGVVVIERAEGLARVFAGKTGRTLDAALQQLGTNGNGDIQGLYDPRSGLTFLVGAALTPETAPAVLLHEATHAKPRADIDARTLALIESRDKAAFKRVREFLRRVAQRMEDAGETGNAAEATAYVVEQAVIEGRQAGFSAVDGRLMSWIGTKLGKRVGDIVRDFVAMVRAWALRAGVKLDPSVDDLVALARMNVRAMGRGNVVRTGSTVSGNRGTFDPANADIRMSRAQRPATEQQSSELESPEAGPGAIARGLGRIAQGLSVVAGAVDAPVDAALRRAFKGTGAAALIRTAGETAGAALSALTPEVIKAGVISDYGLDVSAIDRRDQMYSQMRRELRKAGDTIGLLQNLTLDERKIAYNWMTGEDYGGNFDALPTASKSLLRDVQAQIDELSREAIRLGQLSAEAYERNKMAYLHRSYRKYDLAQTEAERSGSARSVAIRGEQYRGRGMSREVPMSHIQNGAPEWWGRKTQAGKADKQLKGEKFIKLERRAVPTETLTSRQFKNGSLRVRIDSESRPVDEATLPLEQMQGPGNTNPQQKGRLLAVQYWPASVPLPAMYQEWDNAGTWEVRNTRGDKLILWRDFTKEERQRLGEIEDAPYAVAKTLHQMIHDIEVGRYLEYLANNFAMPEAQLPPDARLAEAKEGLHRAFERDEWVLVPQTKVLGTQALKYGKLAGLYVPGPIWNDIRQTVNTKSFMPGWYATILRMWKISKTALSPAVHTNNVMSNLVMADWHDVRPQHIRKAIDVYLDPGIEEHAGLLRAFEESGGMTGMWALTELQREQIEPIVEQLRREAAPAAEAQNMMGVLSALSLIGRLRFADAYAAAAESLPGRGVKTAGRAMIDLYQSEDQLFRLAAFIKAKQNGAPDLEAGRAAKNSFLNYQINAPWIQAMRQTAFPFISFTYRAVPMVLEVAKNRPWKLAKLALYASALNMLAYAIAGGDEEKERALLPEEKAGRMFFGNPKLVRMPWNDANDSPVFLDVRRWVPVGDFFDTGANHAAIPLLPFMVPGGPLALMSELLANKSQFTGREIVLETDTPSEKAAKVIDHLYKAFAPNILVLPGTYAYTGVMNAGGGKTDAFGREQSVALAVASSFGVKLGAYPKDVLAQQAVARHQGRVLEIDRQARAADRELARKGITIKEWTERRKQLDEKKLKEGKALAERMKAAN